MTVCDKCLIRDGCKFKDSGLLMKHCKMFVGVVEEPQEQTKEEWLRTLPIDERVKEILSRGFMTEKRTAEEFVEWLRQPHKEN